MSKARKQAIRQAARLAAPVFAEMGWYYYDSGGIPDEARLEEVLGMLLKEIDRGVSVAEAGRFVVRREDDGEVTLVLELARFEYKPPKKQRRRS